MPFIPGTRRQMGGTMTRQHSPLYPFSEVHKLAQDHGMFVVVKGDHYLLYRRMPDRNVFLGKRSSAPAFRLFVEQCAGVHRPRRKAA